MSEPGSALPAAAREECPEQPRHGKRGAPQAFARKLAEILATESTSIVAWNESGSVFRVVDVERFSQDVLVKHYRHSKFSSFQRQLNLYQFRKIVKGVDAGGYQHPMFHRDRPEDLCHVRRSVSGSGRYDASAAKASAKRTAAALSQRQQGKAGGEGWAASAVTTAPRVRKSSTATRRVGKLRDRAVESRVPAPYGAANTISSPVAVPAAGGMGADHRQAAVALSRQQQQVVAAPRPNSDAGERSPWTSGESSDSDVSVDGGAAAVTTAERWTPNNEQPGSAGAGAAAASSDDGEEAEAEDSSSSDSDGVGGTAAGEGGARRHAQAASDMRRERLQGEEAGEEPLLPRTGGPAAAANGGAGGGSVSPAGSRKSPFNFFKKTFSFIERSNSHRRGMSASNDGGGATAPERPMPSSSSNLGSSSSSSSSSGGGSGSGVPVSTLMVDTSAAARAAAAGVGIGASGRGVRPPPVTVSGGVGHRAAMDASGNKVLTSSMSPLTPKSSMEAAALAAAAATAAMPPPPRREQREELGLVEQLTNMVEVFDICDLLRKVSTSNSSRLDKHGGIVKPKSPHHLRNMSVDTDQGLPQSPLQGRQGQSPTGLGSLASMELVRDSSKDWDTLMAGSADVSDIGNTMVQSVAEFFSF